MFKFADRLCVQTVAVVLVAVVSGLGATPLPTGPPSQDPTTDTSVSPSPDHQSQRYVIRTSGDDASTYVVETVLGESETAPHVSGESGVEGGRRVRRSSLSPLCPWTVSMDTEPYRIPRSIQTASCAVSQCDARCGGAGGQWQAIQQPFDVLTEDGHNSQGQVQYKKARQWHSVACVCLLP